ncbi:hypothetical protein BA78_8541 [Aspergillus fumigatus]|nr:hypothetical protein BA78_8541 [Aspergillus fumigatus]
MSIFRKGKASRSSRGNEPASSAPATIVETEYVNLSPPPCAMQISERIATCIHACMLLVDLSTIYTIEAAAKMGRSPLVFILATVIVAMGEDEEGEEGPMSVSQGEGETFVTQ